MGADHIHGILPVNKDKGFPSFSVVSLLRKRTGVLTIGHTGTLDPLATGVLVMLIGPGYTKLFSQFLNDTKEYNAVVKLGSSTDTYDSGGQTISTSNAIPTFEDINGSLAKFQGTILQKAPIFSAKKKLGVPLYKLARAGKTPTQPIVTVQLTTTIIQYDYPYLTLHIICSSGTYVRSIAHDLGLELGTYAHLTDLERTRNGKFTIDKCVTIEQIKNPHFTLLNYISDTA